MTRVIYDLEGCSLRAEGHAGAGTKGEDIVCAALSILNWTLISAAEEFNLHLFLDEKNGISEVWCDPEEKDEERCRFLFYWLLYTQLLNSRTCRREPHGLWK